MDLESEYNAKFTDLCNKISNNKFMFEITKLCGYGEFLTVYKKQSLLDLYKTVSMQFECKDIKELFFINNCTNEKIRIPITDEITIWQFIFSYNSGSSQVIKPLYPVPCKIVYRIYFDDGHTHGDTTCELKTVT
jgi:hypothetical protein